LSKLDEILAKQPILLFDGECGFCNKAVQFLLKREKNASMHFVPIKSQLGKEILEYFEVDREIDSMILIRDYKAYIRSCAALRLTWYMKGLWPLLSVFLVIPPFMRHPVYNLIAKNRMRFFGKVESCALIPAEQRARVLA
jgi:predicted DCC family thiol-disulfide oxidoreductase YuxK